MRKMRPSIAGMSFVDGISIKPFGVKMTDDDWTFHEKLVVERELRGTEGVDAMADLRGDPTWDIRCL